MERYKVNYWKWRLDNVVSEYRSWSLSISRALDTSLTALTNWPVMRLFSFLFRSTLRPNQPNKAGLKCPSVRSSVCTSVRPQKVPSILMKFGV